MTTCHEAAVTQGHGASWHTEPGLRRQPVSHPRRCLRPRGHGTAGPTPPSLLPAALWGVLTGVLLRDPHPQPPHNQAGVIRAPQPRANPPGAGTAEPTRGSEAREAGADTEMGRLRKAGHFSQARELSETAPSVCKPFLALRTRLAAPRLLPGAGFFSPGEFAGKQHSLLITVAEEAEAHSDGCSAGPQECPRRGWGQGRRWWRAPKCGEEESSSSPW